MSNLKVNTADAYEISAVCYKGLMVQTKDGQPAAFAVLDSNGNVLASGPDVARAAWESSVKAYRNFLIGNGHLRVLAGPPAANAETV